MTSRLLSFIMNIALWHGTPASSSVMEDGNSDRNLQLLGHEEALPVLFSQKTLSQPQAVDFDADGRPGILFGSVGNVRIVWNKLDAFGLTVWDAQYVYTEGYHTFANLAVADFDSDEKIDIVASSTGIRDDYLFLLRNLGERQFETTLLLSSSVGGRLLAVADINSDGFPDIFVSEGPSLFALLNDGSGTFAKTPVNSVDALPTTFVVGDFDGNGAPDFAGWYGDRSALGVSINVGQGSSFEPTLVDTKDPGDGWSVLDISGDGYDDILADGLVYVNDGNTSDVLSFTKYNSSHVPGIVRYDLSQNKTGEMISFSSNFIYRQELVRFNGSQIAGGGERFPLLRVIYSNSNRLSNIEFADFDVDGVTDLLFVRYVRRTGFYVEWVRGQTFEKTPPYIDPSNSKAPTLQPTPATSAPTAKFFVVEDDPAFPGGFPFAGTSNKMALNIRLDDYPSETLWRLERAADCGTPDIIVPTTTSNTKSDDRGWEMVDVGPISAHVTRGELTSETYVLTSSCLYRFQIMDAGGDGICCNHGNGWVSITTSNASPGAGTVLFSMAGNEFHHVATALLWVNETGFVSMVEPSTPAPVAESSTTTCNSGRSCTSSSQCNCGSCVKNCGQIVCQVGICS